MRTKKKKTLDFTFTSTVISIGLGYSPHSVAFCATDYR